MLTLDYYMEGGEPTHPIVRSLPFVGKFIRNERIAGLNFILTKNAFIIHISKWLYYEWRRFRWNVKRGVGLNKTILLLACWWKQKMIVIIDAKTHETYIGDPGTLYRICRNWITKTTKTGTPIYACPISLFARYSGENLRQARTKAKRLGKGRSAKDYQKIEPSKSFQDY